MESFKVNGVEFSSLLNSRVHSPIHPWHFYGDIKIRINKLVLNSKGGCQMNGDDRKPEKLLEWVIGVIIVC